MILLKEVKIPFELVFNSVNIEHPLCARYCGAPSQLWMVMKMGRGLWRRAQGLMTAWEIGCSHISPHRSYCGSFSLLSAICSGLHGGLGERRG